MQTDLKNKIVEAAQVWAAEHKLTQNDLAKKAGINPGYMSNMLRNNYTVEVDGKDTLIAEKWFYKLAETIGFAVKKQYWQTVQTKEFEKTIFELRIAKTDARVITIINDTGLGKTYSVDTFCKVHPQHTYKITANSMHRLRDIINDMANLLGTPIKHNYLDTFYGVCKRLKDLKMMGHQPLIIIDEAENLKLPVIQMLKGLYDYITGYAGIALIGTTQLIDSLNKMQRSNRNGAPQFYRRIKAGIKVIPIYNDFKPFFEKFDVKDKGLRLLLQQCCNNYGELHDYLEPVLKEADETNKPVTEELFRLIHNMPNY